MVFSFCCHREYACDLIYLIACLHSMGLTLEAHLHRCLSSLAGLTCQNYMTESVKYGAVHQLRLKLSPLFGPNGSDRKGLLQEDLIMFPLAQVELGMVNKRA